MTVINYTPPPSLAGFLTSEKFVSLAIGPVGSTKTTCEILKIAYHAARMHPCPDGMRRSRCIWVRQTREQLRDTSIPDFLKWLPDGEAGTFLKTDYKFDLRFNDVHCEVLFRGLDDANDVRRLLSLQATFAVVEEFRELNPAVFEMLQGRLGRYPDKMMVPPQPGIHEGGCVREDGTLAKQIWGASNPPDAETYWEKYLTSPPDNAAVFMQPSALSQDADWLQWLDSDYYTNLAKGKTEDWIDVYIHSRFGRSLAGQPVFRAFNRDIHVAKEPLKFNPATSNPIVVGFDCGLTPTAVIGQLDYRGRLLVYRSLTSDGMGALRFAREKLKPLLVNDFPRANVIVTIDPAGTTRSQTDERTVMDILRGEQLAVSPAKTNTLTARLSAVDSYLTRMIDGKPAVLLDPSCTELVSALQTKYRYKLRKDGDFEDTPEKSHPWSDLADALQYLAMYTDSGTAWGRPLELARREVKAVRYAYA